MDHAEELEREKKEYQEEINSINQRTEIENEESEKIK
jgi:hypothetical protein